MVEYAEESNSEKRSFFFLQELYCSIPERKKRQIIRSGEMAEGCDFWLIFKNIGREDGKCESCMSLKKKRILCVQIKHLVNIESNIERNVTEVKGYL